MEPGARERRKWSRWIRPVGLAIGLSLGCAVLLTLPQVAAFLRSEWKVRIPYPIHWVLTEWRLFWLLLAAGVLLTRRPARIGSLTIPPERWAGLDQRASRLVHGPLAAAVMVLCFLMLAGWIPHYLTWPYGGDTDHFALTAQSWDDGILPYRDLLDISFPGPMYLLWVLGKLFGWGKTTPLYAVDASLLVLLGAALLCWSRRCFGRSLPGLLGYLVFLRYYQSLDYLTVAQRDWQAPLFAVLGLLMLQVWPGRAARVVSALAFAAALVFRPHAVLFLPAIISAIDENARSPGGPRRLTFRALVEWATILAFGILLAFAPVLLAGIFDDFIDTFRTIAWYGRVYNRANPASITSILTDELLRWETTAVLAAIAVLAVVADPALRRTARTWALALSFVLLYKPLSPVAHGYLDHPWSLIWSISIALVVESILRARRLVPSVQVLAVAVVLLESVPGLPTYCSIIRSARAIPPLLRGTEPNEAPLGCERYIRHARIWTSRYDWGEYRAVLDHLRKTTDPQTRVSNFLRQHPFPAVNGPVGRLTAFPCAEGIQWLRWIAPDLEDRFALALAQPQNAVVVWSPDEIGFERLEQTIRRFYQPEARFGTLEVWRRKFSVGLHPRLYDAAPRGAARRRIGDQKGPASSKDPSGDNPSLVPAGRGMGEDSVA
jgi:hypothetical protein